MKNLSFVKEINKNINDISIATGLEKTKVEDIFSNAFQTELNSELPVFFNDIGNIIVTTIEKKKDISGSIKTIYSTKVVVVSAKKQKVILSNIKRRVYDNNLHIIKKKYTKKNNNSTIHNCRLVAKDNESLVFKIINSKENEYKNNIFITVPTTDAFNISYELDNKYFVKIIKNSSTTTSKNRIIFQGSINNKEIIKTLINYFIKEVFKKRRGFSIVYSKIIINKENKDIILFCKNNYIIKEDNMLFKNLVMTRIGYKVSLLLNK